MDLEILKIASDTDNNKYIKNYTHSSKLKNPLCGDEIQIKLVIKNNKIVDFGYQDKSCIYCKAAARLLAKNSINKKIFKINELCDDVKYYFEENSNIIKKKWFFLNKLLSKKNYKRKECILLPFKTLKRIVSN